MSMVYCWRNSAFVIFLTETPVHYGRSNMVVYMLRFGRMDLLVEYMDYIRYLLTIYCIYKILITIMTISVFQSRGFDFFLIFDSKTLIDVCFLAFLQIY